MNKAPLIYNVSPLTGEYIITDVPCYADPDPLDETNWLVPAYASLTPPPPLLKYQAAVLEHDGWKVVPDYRGTVYSTVTGEPVIVETLGELPEGLTELEPPADSVWNITGWIVSEELQAKSRLQKIDEYSAKIEAVADQVRDKINGTASRIIEDSQTVAEAIDFKSKGYPADNVPRMISSRMNGGFTAEQVTDHIIKVSEYKTDCLYKLVEIRLPAKDKIKEYLLVDLISQANDVLNETIGELRAVVVDLPSYDTITV